MTCGGIAQLARVLGSYPIGRWFESCCRYHGPLVKRLRHRPFTAESWVRFPYGSPSTLLSNGFVKPFESFFFCAKTAYGSYMGLTVMSGILSLLLGDLQKHCNVL